MTTVSGTRHHTEIVDAQALEVLEALVRTPSVSGTEAQACAVFVAHAHYLGFDSWIDDAGNAIAQRGTPGPNAREILLLGHIDTVPGNIPVRIESDASGWHGPPARGSEEQSSPTRGSGWHGSPTRGSEGQSSPTRGSGWHGSPTRVSEGQSSPTRGSGWHGSPTRVLWGRGSVDAKGPLAAFLVAASRARIPDGVRVVVIGAVGEETPRSPGANHLARSRPAPAACIIGEPSGAEGVTLGYKGRLIVHAEVTRSCAHTAGPDASAADALLAWWRAEESALDAPLPQSREVHLAGASAPRTVFDSIQRTVRTLASHSDGLTDSARMVVGFRLPPGVDPHTLERDIRSRAGDGVTLRFEGHERAVISDRNDPVALALTSAIRAEGLTPRPKRKTGTADWNVVAPHWSCPIAAYGPGDSAMDHTPDERLDLAEYATAIRVLTRAIEGLAEP